MHSLPDQGKEDGDPGELYDLHNHKEEILNKTKTRFSLQYDEIIIGLPMTSPGSQ